MVLEQRRLGSAQGAGKKGDLEKIAGGAALVSQRRSECRECGRTPSMQKDFKRYKCLHEGS